MIDHTGTYALDFAKAKRFYDAALGALGYTVQREMVATWDPDFPTRHIVAYGDTRPIFWLIEVKDKRTPVHIAFVAKDEAGVHAFHAAGLAAGGSDNGKPGTRQQYHPGYYGSFLLDPEGNNVEAVIHHHRTVG